MDVQINRQYAAPTAGIAVAATASGAVVLGVQGRGYRKGVIQLPSTWVTCTAQFKAAVVSGGAYTDLYDKTGAVVKIPSTVASRAYELPDACLVGCYGLKVIKSTKQTTTAGAAAGATPLQLVFRD